MTPAGIVRTPGAEEERYFMTNSVGRLTLPSNPDIEFLRREAKLRHARMQARAPNVQLAEAQLALARDYGFSSWRAFKAEVDNRSSTSRAEPISEPEEIALGAPSRLYHARQSPLIPSCSTNLLDIISWDRAPSSQLHAKTNISICN